MPRCELCDTFEMNEFNYNRHIESEKHLQAMIQDGHTPDDQMDAELKAAVENPNPVEAAKAVRRIFASREWPNAEHPGTVKDLLEQYHVPQPPSWKGRPVQEVEGLRQDWMKQHTGPRS